MSSLFNHVFIPLVILLLFSEKFKIHPKNVFILAIFGIIPDIDIFFYHRASFHNIFLVLIPFIFFILRDKKEIPGIICFYLTSHLLLDIFNGGVYILYPFNELSFYVKAELAFRNNIFLPVLDFGFRPSISGAGEPAVSSENIGVVLILILISGVSILKKKLMPFKT